MIKYMKNKYKFNFKFELNLLGLIKLISFISFFLIFQKAYSGRELVNPPIGTYIKAGDTVCADPAGALTGCNRSVSCTVADVDGRGSVGEGVKGTSNSYYLQLVNVSNIPQTVTVTFETTDLGIAHSLPRLDSPGISQSTSKNLIVPVQIDNVIVPPNSNKQVGFTIFCSNSSCYGKLGKNVTQADNDPNSGGKLAHSCYYMYSTVKVKLNIKEDRGAIQGFFAVTAARLSGSKDKQDAFHTFLNGGRPF